MTFCIHSQFIVYMFYINKYFRHITILEFKRIKIKTIESPLLMFNCALSKRTWMSYRRLFAWLSHSCSFIQVPIEHEGMSFHSFIWKFISWIFIFRLASMRELLLLPLLWSQRGATLMAYCEGCFSQCLDVNKLRCLKTGGPDAQLLKHVGPSVSRWKKESMMITCCTRWLPTLCWWFLVAPLWNIQLFKLGSPKKLLKVPLVLWKCPGSDMSRNRNKRRKLDKGLISISYAQLEMKRRKYIPNFKKKRERKALILWITKKWLPNKCASFLGVW